jgi:hypothetical protein
MKVRKLTIRQAHELMVKNEKQNLGMDIRIAETHHAPGGGEMITFNSHLTPSALQFIARRKRSLDAPVSVIIYEPGDDEKYKTFRNSEALPPEVANDAERMNDQQRAKDATQRVTRSAARVSKHAEQIHSVLTGASLKSQDLSRPEVKQALSIFGSALKRFRKNTEKAIEEYIVHGNTLIMDLITQHDINVLSLKHALKVACFATELVAMMGEKEYFSTLSSEEVFEQLGETPEGPVTDKLLREKKQVLFKRELVEVFLGGFMHDAGLWQSGRPEGHEIRGAMIVAQTPQIEMVSKTLIDLVLFHSDIKELAANEGVMRIFGLSDEGEVVAFHREFFKTQEDVQVAERLQKPSFSYKIFTETDLRKIIPVAIAEVFISLTQSRKATSRQDAVTDLASLSEGGLYQAYMVALCNMQSEVIAPARAMVELGGSISVNRGDQPRWLDTTGSQAVSVGHDDSRHSPHLIVIFSREEDGSQKILTYLSPKDQRLWDRSDSDCRMYIPGGRFRSLTYKVVAILRQDIYEKHFKAYEQEVQQRIQAAIIF